MLILYIDSLGQISADLLHPKILKNLPPDNVFGHFLYQTDLKKPAQIASNLRIAQKPKIIFKICKIYIVKFIVKVGKCKFCSSRE